LDFIIFHRSLIGTNFQGEPSRSGERGSVYWVTRNDPRDPSFRPASQRFQLARPRAPGGNAFMPRSNSRSISLPLSISRFRAKDGELPRIRCRRCNALLQIHQPELETPERLLGTCPECHQWCLIESPAGQGWATIAAVPPGGLAPDSSEEDPAPRHQAGTARRGDEVCSGLPPPGAFRVG
jgi:hypothetical protein